MFTSRGFALVFLVWNLWEQNVFCVTGRTIFRKCAPLGDEEIFQGRSFKCPPNTFLTLPRPDGEELSLPRCRRYRKECSLTPGCIPTSTSSRKPFLWCSEVLHFSECPITVSKIELWNAHKDGSARWSERLGKLLANKLKLINKGDETCLRVIMDENLLGLLLKVHLSCSSKAELDTDNSHCLILKVQGKRKYPLLLDANFLLPPTAAATTRMSFRRTPSTRVPDLFARLVLSPSPVRNTSTVRQSTTNLVTTPSPLPASTKAKVNAIYKRKRVATMYILLTLCIVVVVVLLAIFLFFFLVYLRALAASADNPAKQRQLMILSAALTQGIGTVNGYPESKSKPVQLEQNPYDFLKDPIDAPKESVMYSAVYHDRKKDLDQKARNLPANIINPVDAHSDHIYEIVNAMRPPQEQRSAFGLCARDLERQPMVGKILSSRKSLIPEEEDEGLDDVFNPNVDYKETSSANKGADPKRKTPSPTAHNLRARSDSMIPLSPRRSLNFTSESPYDVLRYHPSDQERKASNPRDKDLLRQEGMVGRDANFWEAGEYSSSQVSEDESPYQLLKNYSKVEPGNKLSGTDSKASQPGIYQLEFEAYDEDKEPIYDLVGHFSSSSHKALVVDDNHSDGLDDVLNSDFDNMSPEMVTSKADSQYGTLSKPRGADSGSIKSSTGDRDAASNVQNPYDVLDHSQENRKKRLSRVSNTASGRHMVSDMTKGASEEHGAHGIFGVQQFETSVGEKPSPSEQNPYTVSPKYASDGNAGNTSSTLGSDTPVVEETLGKEDQPISGNERSEAYQFEGQSGQETEHREPVQMVGDAPSDVNLS